MKGKSVITLSTLRHTWSISLRSATLFSLVILSMLIALGAAAGFYSSAFLFNQKEQITLQYDEKQQQYTASLKNRELLENNIVGLHDTIGHQKNLIEKSTMISQILNLDKVNDIFGYSEDSAIDKHRSVIVNKLANIKIENDIRNEVASALLDVSEKTNILYHLPSGSPLEKDSYISSGYGYRVHPVYLRRQHHYGIDLPLKIGDGVVTTASGVVTYVGKQAGYGLTVIVEHRFGFSTKYAHLSKILVSRGDVVSKGDVVAEGGNTGISTGPHVHYEIKYLGRAFNPYSFYDWNLANFNDIFRRHQNIKWQQIVNTLRTEEAMRETLLSLRTQN